MSQKFKHLESLRVIQDALITVNSNNFKIISVNKAACDLYQYTKKEFLQLKVIDISNEPEDTIKSIKECIKYKEIIPIPISHHKKKDGTIFPVSVYNGILNQNSITILVRDLTKYIEEKIYSSIEDRLHYLLDNIQAFVFYKDLENRFIWVNKFLLNAFGKKEKEVIGKKVEEVLGDSIDSIEMSKEYFENDKEVVRTKRAKLGIVEQYKTKDGIRWAKTDKIPFIDYEGNVIGIFGFSTDITELRNTCVQLEEIVNSIPDLIFIIDKDHRYVKNISGDKKDLYLKEEEFIGKKIEEVMPSDVTKIALEAFDKVNQNPQKSVKFKYKLSINDEEKTFEANLRRLNSNKFIAIIRDITERVKFQILEDFKSSVERLIESNRNLKEEQENE